MRSPFRERRFPFSRKPSADPIAPENMPAELEARDRALREAHHQIEKLRAELNERKAETDALRRVGEATGSAFDIEAILKVIADVAIQITGTDSCQVYLYDRKRDCLVLRAADETGSSMVGKIRLKVGEGITGWVARERKHVSIPRNAAQDHRFRYFPEIKEEEFASILSVPLVHKNQMLGVVNVRTREPHEYSKNQVRLLSGIASQVAGAIEKSRRTRMLERTVVHVHNLSEVSQAITANTYIDETLRLFVEMTARTMGYRVCTVMLVDKQTQQLVIKATQSKSQEYTKKPPLKVGESIAGRAVADAKVMTVLDVRQHPEYRFPDVAEKAGLCSLASVPLTFKGEVMGVLNCYTEKVHEFGPEEIAILQALGAQAALAIQAARLMVKSALIQEMHHRIKNNLQQIASLVHLQMHYSEFTTTEQALTDTLNRILAIAAVHELLLRDDLDSVSMNKVSEQILTATKQSVVAPGKTVQTLVEGPELFLPLKHATTLALVLNELVQNAVEHGFRDRDQGRIGVLIAQERGHISITVTNDGDALPDGFDAAKSGSLGLKIVGDLVRGGLGGHFTIGNTPDGIASTVRFPRKSS